MNIELHPLYFSALKNYPRTDLSTKGPPQKANSPLFFAGIATPRSPPHSGIGGNNRAPKRSINSVREYSTTRVPNLSQSSISSPKQTSTKPCDLSPFTYPTGFLVPCLLVFNWLLLVFYWLICTQLHDETPLGQSSLASVVLA